MLDDAYGVNSIFIRIVGELPPHTLWVVLARKRGDLSVLILGICDFQVTLPWPIGAFLSLTTSALRGRDFQDNVMSSGVVREEWPAIGALGVEIQRY